MHVHQRVSADDAYAHAYTHADADADAHAYAYTHAHADAHADAHAYTHTHTYAYTSGPAYGSASHADADAGGDPCPASGTAAQRRQWRNPINHGLGCVGVLGWWHGLDAGGHGQCCVGRQAAEQVGSKKPLRAK